MFWPKNVLAFAFARNGRQHVLAENAKLNRTPSQGNQSQSQQARGQPQPAYHVVAEEGPSHEREFTIEVRVEKRRLGSGRARSKKQAEQQAAREALDRLREEEIEAAEAAKQ